jgi:hypothetical protein
MSYTKRTCHSCGYRDIQPNMVQREIQYKSGSSKRGIGGREVLGTLIGNEKSEKAIQNWMSTSSKRNYTRTRKVWMCPSCAKASNNNDSGYETIIGICIVIGIILALI